MLQDYKKQTSVLLVKPKNKSFTVTPPLGLGYLAGTLKKNGYRAEIMDLDIVSEDQLIESIARLNPGLIGITGMSVDYAEMGQLILLFRKVNPKSKIVLGGNHVSAMPGEVFNKLNPDFIVIGEGEITLLELTRRMDQGNALNYEDIHGLCFKKNGSMIMTPEREFVQDLDELEIDWEALNILKYPRRPHNFIYKKWPFTSYITSRGCPNDCIYCTSPKFWRRKIRFHSAKRIADDMEFLMKHYNIKEFRFADDNITVSSKHVHAICDEVIHRQLNIHWSCPNGIHYDTLDENLIYKMRKSGFYFCGIGIEFGNKKSHDFVKRKVNYDKLAEVIRTLKMNKIITLGFFIIGLPVETEKDLLKTFEVSRDIGVDLAVYSVFAPLPGSEMYESIQNKTGKKFNNISFFDSLAVTKDGTMVKKYQRSFMLKFYLRPRPLITLFSVIKFHSFYHIIKSFFNLLRQTRVGKKQNLISKF